MLKICFPLNAKILGPHFLHSIKALLADIPASDAGRSRLLTFGYLSMNLKNDKNVWNISEMNRISQTASALCETFVNDVQRNGWMNYQKYWIFDGRHLWTFHLLTNSTLMNRRWRINVENLLSVKLEDFKSALFTFDHSIVGCHPIVRYSKIKTSYFRLSFHEYWTRLQPWQKC